MRAGRKTKNASDDYGASFCVGLGGGAGGGGRSWGWRMGGLRGE